jgi:hypothetical protein
MMTRPSKSNPRRNGGTVAVTTCLISRSQIYKPDRARIHTVHQQNLSERRHQPSTLSYNNLEPCRVIGMETLIFSTRAIDYLMHIHFIHLSRCDGISPMMFSNHRRCLVDLLQPALAGRGHHGVTVLASALRRFRSSCCHVKLQSVEYLLLIFHRPHIISPWGKSEECHHTKTTTHRYFGTVSSHPSNFPSPLE